MGKCAKKSESMRKCAKSSESVCDKSSERLPKPEKV